MQAEADVATALVDQVPAAQEVHTEAPAVDHVPAPQLIHTAPLRNVPVAPKIMI